MTVYRESMLVSIIHSSRCFLTFLLILIFVAFRPRVGCPVPQECVEHQPTLSCTVRGLDGCVRVS